MKFRTRNVLTYDPMTFAPTRNLIISYDSEGPWHEGVSEEQLKELVTAQFQELLTKPSGWDSDTAESPFVPE